MWAGEGIAYIISNGTTIMLDRKAFPANESFYQFAASTIPGIKVPWIVLVAIIFIVAFYLIMTYTTFGRLIMATGSNETAAKYAGINTSKYYFAAYLICGILTGLAGVIVTAKAGSATPLTASVDYGMTAIAGIVIGGTSMSGGEGTIPKTILGILIVAFISNIMNLINVAVYPQKVVKAIIVIVAVIVKSFSEKK
jgi:ribose transport system permease protein